MFVSGNTKSKINYIKKRFSNFYYDFSHSHFSHQPMYVHHIAMHSCLISEKYTCTAHAWLALTLIWGMAGSGNNFPCSAKCILTPWLHFMNTWGHIFPVIARVSIFSCNVEWAASQTARGIAAVGLCCKIRPGGMGFLLIYFS